MYNYIFAPNVWIRAYESRARTSKALYICIGKNILSFKPPFSKEGYRSPWGIEVYLQFLIGGEKLLKVYFHSYSKTYSRENITTGYDCSYSSLQLFLKKNICNHRYLINLGKELYYPYDYSKWSPPHCVSTRNYRAVLIILGKRQAKEDIACGWHSLLSSIRIVQYYPIYKENLG